MEPIKFDNFEKTSGKKPVSQSNKADCCSPAAPSALSMLSPLSTTGSCPPPPVIDRKAQPFVTGIVQTKAGEIPKVATTLTRSDRIGAIKSRLSNFRMAFIVEPGLYAVGAPDADSEVIVTANYKLTFDSVRRELSGLSVWVLVLDTKSINVWCAAGKRTFSTEEVIKRVQEARLDEIVSHKRLILPQLGAPGVQAHKVKDATGFRVSYGPVRASDLKAYLEAGRKATDEMRRVRFGLWDRVVLTPLEIVPAFKHFPLFAVVVLVVFGLAPEGVMFGKAFYEGGPFVLLGLGAVLSGALVTPALLPYIPVRSFALKGFVTGGALTWLLLGPLGITSGVLMALALVFFPAISSYIALQLTGSTTFTGMTGVKKEIKLVLPVYFVCLGCTVLLLAAYKIMTWGVA